jgi:hypothetical protein
MGASAAFAEAIASIMTKIVLTGARRPWRRKLNFMATSIQVSPTEPAAKVAEPS